MRFIKVADRTASMLTNVIQSHVEEGSVIVTEQWKVYNRLADNGYGHFTVNHSQNCADPDTRYHIQGIERAWVDAKAYTKRARGYSNLLQYHLDELSWRKSVANSGQDVMSEFWNAVTLVHNTL